MKIALIAHTLRDNFVSVATGAAVFVLHIVGKFLITRYGPRVAAKGVSAMNLTGKVVDAKIGNVGEADVDVGADGTITVEAQIAINKEITDGVTAVVNTDVKVVTSVPTVLAAQASKNPNSTVLKFLADMASHLKTTGAVPAQVQALADAHAVAPLTAVAQA